MLQTKKFLPYLFNLFFEGHQIFVVHTNTKKVGSVTVYCFRELIACAAYFLFGCYF